MSTLHKVKAYFGMAPMDDYEDEYYDDRAPSRGFPRPRFDEAFQGYGRYDGDDYDDARREPADYHPRSGYRGGYSEEAR
jgi:cell division inhibitor SepF